MSEGKHTCPKGAKDVSSSVGFGKLDSSERAKISSLNCLRKDEMKEGS